MARSAIRCAIAILGLVSLGPLGVGSALDDPYRMPWQTYYQQILPRDDGAVAFVIGNARDTAVCLAHIGQEGARLLRTYPGWQTKLLCWRPGTDEVVLAVGGGAYWLQIILLDTCTGRDRLVYQYEGRAEVREGWASADGKRLIWSGFIASPLHGGARKPRSGAFSLDLATGALRQLVEAEEEHCRYQRLGNRELLLYALDEGANWGNLCLLDLATGKSTDTGVAGFSSCLSPDGRWLAYEVHPSFTDRGPEGQGGVWLRDLQGGREATFVYRSYAYPKCWDGNTLVFMAAWNEQAPPGSEQGAMRVGVFAAEPGGAPRLLRQGVTNPTRYAPAPGGKAVRVVEGTQVLELPLDGSPARTPLKAEMRLDADTLAQLEGASDALLCLSSSPWDLERQWRKGDLAALQEAVEKMASCERVPAAFPRARLSEVSLGGIAALARAHVAGPEATMLARMCGDRVRLLGGALSIAAGLLEHYPASLEEARRALAAVPEKDRRYRSAIEYLACFDCPAGGEYLFQPPAPGQEPALGQTLLRCPRHADSRVVWGREEAEGLSDSRLSTLHDDDGAADQRLSTLWEFAEKAVREARYGGRPWAEVEAAMREMLAADPDHPQARVYLGALLARQGRPAEALALLPQAETYTHGLAPLTRALCLDTLGRREEALTWYGQLEPRDGDWYFVAALGLRQPLHPGVPAGLQPEPVEARLAPQGWQVTTNGEAWEGNRAGNAADGDPATDWCSGHQLPGRRLEVTFPEPLLASRVALDHLGDGYDCAEWPEGLRVEISPDGQSWQEVPSDPGGPFAAAGARFAAQRVKAVRFTLTRRQPLRTWTVAEVHVFGPAAAARGE